MINELSGLSDALDGAGIKMFNWHQKYKPLPNVKKDAPCFRIYMGQDGIEDIEPLSKEIAEKLRKYGTNQGTFPAINLAPLYRITNESEKKRLEEMKADRSLIDIEMIRSWCTSDNWAPNSLGSLKNSLYNVPQEIMSMLSSTISEEKDELAELIQLIHTHFPEKKIMLIHEALETVLFEKLKKQEDAAAFLFLLFHSKGSEKGAKADAGRISVIWELAEWGKYGYPISSERFTRNLNAMLVEADHCSKSKGEKTEKDAFGMDFSPLSEPMPSVKLAGGFEATIYTMFEGQPCQNRYNSFERKVTPYPLSPENRASFKNALEWISDQEKEGQTWRKIGDKEILFAYPSKLIPRQAMLASFFGGYTEEAQDAIFCKVAKHLMDCLEGIEPEQRPGYIRIFILQKVDKARTKILLSRNLSMEQLFEVAELWKAGCGNVPDFDCAPIGSKLLTAPFPIQVADTVNKIWRVDGQMATQGKVKAKVMRHYQGVELILDAFTNQSKMYFLHALFENYRSLAMWYGNLLHSGRRSETYKQEWDLYRAVTIMGLLLFYNNIRKEQYMENFPYLFGQLLKVSDELHTLYCKVVRDGQIPSQLAGSAMYNAAAENPVATLAQLATRMNPYISWAKSYVNKNEKDSKLAGWYMKIYKEIADQLKNVCFDKMATGFNDCEKAEFFIGYLAAFPKKENNMDKENKENE